MAVHLPLSIEAQVEATVLMMSTNNIFSPANGQPIISPSQDIVMGCYYLTASRGQERGGQANVERYEPAGTLKQVRFALDEPCEAGEGMVFANVGEVFTAYGQKKLGVHARIQVRLPFDKKVISEIRTDKGLKVDDVPRKPNGLVITTVGRVLFNDILAPKMAFYDVPMTSKHLARVISDCYLILGRRETIDLLDRMKELGFRESTRSGLSFATDDLKTPGNKEGVLRGTSKEVDRYLRQYADGNITELERYNKVIDLWTHARDEITRAMMEDLKNDRRDGKPYLNPIYLMAYSGARGGVEQIRQLCGMRGLMAKPNGTIIETPIKANFREGLSVLEYFSSTHGARKGLADTALKTADSGYLTRKLADVAQNVVVTMHDCGTTQGVSKSAVYKGDEIERPLSESIRGRVSRNSIENPVSRDVIVKENEMITVEQARKVEALGVDKILVRSPMTCKAPLGVCRLCYGMDLATGALVEEGMAVGIIAAQSIGEPGTQLTMRTFHIGGVVKREVGENEAKTKKGGVVKYERINDVINDKGERVALSSGTGEILILGPNGRAVETFSIPNGSLLQVANGATVAPMTVLAKWDPHITPILSEKGGKVRLVEIVENQTLRKDRDETTGAERWVIMEHKGDLHPRLNLEDDAGQVLETHYMPERAVLEVREGGKVSPGTLLAKLPREVSGTQDITGGLPRVTEIFEARTPRDPAKMAEVQGVVRLGERKRGKRTIYVQPVDDHGKKSGEEVEHVVPPGKHVRVNNGDRVKKGDRLVFGPLIPHEILKISGPDAVQHYLVQEVQAVYRSQRVEIDDKHIEIIVAQMLRKVMVKGGGDTGLLPGSVIDKFAFQAVNDRLRECVKIRDRGDSRFEEGRVVAREAYEEERARLEAEDKEPPTWEQPQHATSTVQLLGITKAAVQSDSFISAASFQETTKVLTEAALAGKVDYLVGLKENVILGHLVPAGTGFRSHQEAEVRLNAPQLHFGRGHSEEAASEAGTLETVSK
jgi:DNA-directed RNA polymerase subunit beta'